MVQKNAFLAWPNQLFADEAFAQVTIGGGDWMPENPLSNLLDPRLSVPAVSTDVTSEGTQFWVDLGQSRRIKVFAMPWIRGWTRAGLLSGYPLLTVRARIYSSQSTASTLIYDSSFVDQHPVIFDRSTLPSTHPSFLTGRITPEDAAAFAWKQPWWHWIGSGEILGRHILFEIEASRSSLERIEIPYLIIAPGYQPTLNMQYGASLGVEDLSIISEAQSGAEFADVRPKRRVARFTLNEGEDEGLTQAFDMMLRLGTTTPLFFGWAINDTVHKQRRAFLGRLRRLSQLEFTTFGRTKAAFEISEVLD